MASIAFYFCHNRSFSTRLHLPHNWALVLRPLDVGAQTAAQLNDQTPVQSKTKISISVFILTRAPMISAPYSSREPALNFIQFSSVLGHLMVAANRESILMVLTVRHVVNSWMPCAIKCFVAQNRRGVGDHPAESLWWILWWL